MPDLVTRSRFGSWAAGSDVAKAHTDLEALVQTKLPIFSWFWSSSYGWDQDASRKIAAIDTTRVYDNMLCLEVNFQFSDIVSGRKDSYFKEFFDGAKTYPGRVILRLFHEANGDWYTWSIANSGRRVTTVDQWIQAWRRVVGIGRERATNVQFMFCMNSTDSDGPKAEEYWPGTDWVDIIGLDGYNWGWDGDRPWMTAEKVIEPMYERLTKLHPTAEFMIGEISTVAGAGKAQWFSDLFTSQKFSRLTQVCFFHESKDGSHDWRLNSDAGSLKVVQTQLKRAPQVVPPQGSTPSEATQIVSNAISELTRLLNILNKP